MDKFFYICGFLCSKGKVVWNEKHSIYSIALQTRDEYLSSLFHAKLSEITQKEVKIYKNGHFLVVLHDKHLIKRLKETCDLGRYTWRVPDQCFNDLWLGKAYLQGIFDAGGNIIGMKTKKGKKRIIRLNSINKPGLLGIKNLLMLFDISANIYTSREYSYLFIEGKTRCQAFKDKIGMNNEKKLKQLDDILSYE